MKTREGIFLALIFLLLQSPNVLADAGFFDLCRLAFKGLRPAPLDVDLEQPLLPLDGVIDAVVVVIKREGQYLLGYRGGAPMQGLWGQLGGKVGDGESIAQTALREVREESGLEVGRLKFLFQTSAYLEENGKTYRIFVVEALSFSGEARVTEEKTPILGWFSYELIPEKLTSATAEFFQKYLR